MQLHQASNQTFNGARPAHPGSDEGGHLGTQLVVGDKSVFAFRRDFPGPWFADVVQNTARRVAERRLTPEDKSRLLLSSIQAGKSGRRLSSSETVITLCSKSPRWWKELGVTRLQSINSGKIASSTPQSAS